jgi:sulfite reductase alpha subunit-like flavoprotein
MDTTDGGITSTSSSTTTILPTFLYYATQSGKAKACARRVYRKVVTWNNNATHAASAAAATQSTVVSLQGPPISFDEALVQQGRNNSFLQLIHYWRSFSTTASDSVDATSTTAPLLSPPPLPYCWLILFVSTTGDGEIPDTMTNFWKVVRHKGLSATTCTGIHVSLFSLGDRAYGPAFGAAARKVAIRFLQLGATLVPNAQSIGYGDDGTPGGGVWVDLDDWVTHQLQPQFLATIHNKGALQEEELVIPSSSSSSLPLVVPYQISIPSTNSNSNNNHNNHTHTTTFPQDSNGEQIEKDPDVVEENDDGSSPLKHMNDFFRQCGPLTAYHYTPPTQTTDGPEQPQQQQPRPLPLLAKVTVNQRLTPHDWEQDTRHIRLVIDTDTTTTLYPSSLGTQLPYRAGDVLAVMPVNSIETVNQFVAVLPPRLQALQDEWMGVTYSPPNTDGDKTNNTSFLPVGVAYPYWPKRMTLRQWLTYCADIAALPEREDLWAISHYCDIHQHPMGQAQCEKLQSLAETSATALYTDYIVRQKRSWIEVLHDFDSLQTDDSGLTVETLVSLLGPLRPREYSIASAPTVQVQHSNPQFAFELTVAVVEGTTPLGRSYHGLCSYYLAHQCSVGTTVRVWIRPGSFAGLPLESNINSATKIPPVLYAGAGTGVAPLRGLIQERQAVILSNRRTNQDTACASNNAQETDGWNTPEILLFGCRKESTDFYYKEEWEKIVKDGSLTLLTAFSRDQWHKFYVQQRIKREDPQGIKLLNHLVTQGGYLYIAGGAKMARSIKEEIVELLDPHMGGKATQYLAKLQRLGRFRVEAWS